MKKFIAMTLALVMMLAMFAGCSAKEEATTAATEATTAATEATTAATEATTAAPEADIHAKGEGVMTYEEYAAAELNSEVVSKLSYRLSSPGGKTRLQYIFRTRTALISYTKWLAPKKIMLRSQLAQRSR